MGLSMVLIEGTTLGLTISVFELDSSFSGWLILSSLYTLMWGVVLKKDSPEVLSNPAAIEFMNIKMDTPITTPKIATIVILLEAIK
jgi:hypothetical protein